MMTKIVMYSLLPIALGAVGPTDLLLRRRQLNAEVNENLKSIKEKTEGIMDRFGIPGLIKSTILDQLTTIVSSIPGDILQLTDQKEIFKYLVEKSKIPGSCVDLVDGGSFSDESARLCARDFALKALSSGPLVEALEEENNKSFAIVFKVVTALNFGVFVFPSLAPGLPLGKTLSRRFLWVGEAISDLATFVWAWIAVYFGGNYRYYYMGLAIASMIVAILKSVVSFIPFVSGVVNSVVFRPIAFWIKLITVVITQYVPMYYFLNVQSTVMSFLKVN